MKSLGQVVAEQVVADASAVTHLRIDMQDGDGMDTVEMTVTVPEWIVREAVTTWGQSLRGVTGDV